jgi:hypothetical protein
MAGTTVEGIIEQVKTKTVGQGTSWGPKDVQSFKMNGEWYNGGFKRWEVDEGDEVAITFITNEKGYKDAKGIAVKAKGAPPARASTGVPRAGRSFPVDPLAPERTINRQNALTAAANLVAAQLAAGGIPDGTDLSQAVISYAKDFEAYTTGDIEREAAEAMAAMQQEVA